MTMTISLKGSGNHTGGYVAFKGDFQALDLLHWQT